MPLIDSSRRRLLTVGAAALASLALTPAAHAATIDVHPLTVAPTGYTMAAPITIPAGHILPAQLETKHVTFHQETCGPVGTAVGTAQAGVAAASAPSEGTVPQEGHTQVGHVTTPEEGEQPCADEPAPEEPYTTPTPPDKSNDRSIEDEEQARREQQRRAQQILDEMLRGQQQVINGMT